MLELAQRITLALGGTWRGTYGSAPAPGHTSGDRSLSIRRHRSNPDDVFIKSFAGEDELGIKDELRRRGLLPVRHGSLNPPSVTPLRALPEATLKPDDIQERLKQARGLWARSQPIAGTPAERYLREVRSIGGELPSTLRFLPPRGKYPPAMIAAFGLPEEPEPGVLRIAAADIMGVHLTKLRLDGLGKADEQPNKIMIGRGHTLPLVLAPVNDGLGLVITEGIEDALSISEATGLGVWAAGSASRLPGVAKHIPSYVECLTIAVDDDPAGEKYSRELAGRVREDGVEVRLIDTKGRPHGGRK